MILDAREGPADRSEQQRTLHTGIETGSLKRYESALVAMGEVVAQERAEREQQLQTVKRWVGGGLLLSLMCGLALLALSSELLHSRFAKPLSALLASIRRISEGHLDHRVAESGVAEIRDLARGINTMSSELSASRLSLVHAEKQAELGSLVPVVAHNIRNPLASIRATAQIIDSPTLPTDVRDGLQDIVGATDRLESWTHSLLSYLNPLQPNCQWVTLQKVSDTCIGLLSARTTEREVSIRRIGWDLGVRVEADVALLEQALTGLLMNAIEASPVGGQITLAADTITPMVRLSIRDQGSGMAVLPSASRRLTTRSTKAHGSGLGVPFCRKVCEGHGGQLSFVAHADGTEVIVTLPQKAVHLAKH
jgi:signal transduction histidine kinase